MKEETGCSLPDAVIVKAWTSGETDAVFLFAALNVAPDDLSHSGFLFMLSWKNLSEKSGRGEKLCAAFHRKRHNKFQLPALAKAICGSF